MEAATPVVSLPFTVSQYRITPRANGDRPLGPMLMLSNADRAGGTHRDADALVSKHV